MPTTISADTPGELLALLPHMLGYHPDEQLVVAYIRDQVVRGCILQPLPLDNDPSALAAIAHGARRVNADTCLVIGYGREQLTTPALETVVPYVAAEFPIAVFRVHDGRYYTLGDHTPQHVIDHQPLPDAPAAVAIAHGMAPARSRQDLLTRLAPVTGRRRHISTYMGLIAALDMIAALPADPDNPRTPIAEPAVAAARAIVDTARATWSRTNRLDDKHMTQLALATHIIEVRDEIISTIAAEYMADHRDSLRLEQSMWLTVMRHVPLQLIAPPATLYALTAWATGDYLHASQVLNHALAHHPTYEMATMLYTVVDHVVPPDTSMARLACPAALTRTRQGPGEQAWMPPFVAAVDNMLATFTPDDIVAAVRLIPACPRQPALEPSRP
ncbi:DUF4192 domain-containing protein [Nonomuraea polychroma]|uniref:DUF4192 domain-containing protein n=1 Tax=Nonomuraea polychroma TaxID=46176 RepID=UPI003D93F943